MWWCIFSSCCFIFSYRSIIRCNNQSQGANTFIDISHKYQTRMFVNTISHSTLQPEIVTRPNYCMTSTTRFPVFFYSAIVLHNCHLGFVDLSQYKKSHFIFSLHGASNYLAISSSFNNTTQNKF